MQPGTRLGPYEIVAAIGVGGMGEVYRARDTRLGRDVAIKVLPADLVGDAERLKRFEREAKATAALSHPNILAVHDVGTSDGVPYLVEELLDGESLRERLSRGAIPVREAVGIAIQVAHGLAAAHEKHIVHRDLKPANLFITSEGTVKILDFGLAKLVEGATLGDADTLTHAPTGATDFGRVLGTMAYMAPEQARGQTVDQRADIFSFGVVLYEMLAGERPFRGETATDTVAAILKEEPPSLPESVPPALRGVVTQCLAKRPDQRFSSGHDLELALQAASSQGATPPPTPVDTGVARLSRPRGLLVGGGVLAAAAVVAALVIWHPWHVPSTSVASGPGHVPSILALPCKVYGAPEVAFLTDAVPATISTLLAQVEGLDTKVPPTSFEVEKVKGDLTTLAELYQVSSFIVTSINASSGSFALNVQLVDAATRSVRWSRQLEGPRDAYNDLARQAAEGIRQALKPAAPPVPTSGTSSEAELAFRQGEFLLKRYQALGRQADFEAALEATTRALEADPTLASAAAQIGSLHMTRSLRQGTVEPGRTELQAWARRALEIDPRCADAWADLSFAEMHASRVDDETVIVRMLRAATFGPLNPNVHNVLGDNLSGPGSLGLWTAANLHAFDLDPFLMAGAASASLGLACMGKPDKALELLDKALRVEPGYAFLQTTRGFALGRLGRLDEAEAALRGAEAPVGRGPIERSMWLQISLGVAVARRDQARAEKLAAEVVSAALEPGAIAFLVGNASMFAAPALVSMGRPKDALRILERETEIGGAEAYDRVLTDRGLDPLRSDPRFARVLAVSRDGAIRVVKILQEARARGELPSYLNQPLDELVKLLKTNGAAI